MKEVWKDISGYEGLYQASNLGRIKRLKNNLIFKNVKNHHGYYHVTLTKNKKQQTKDVHRMIAITFLPKNNNKNYINHKDCNKLNNKIENLEWCTSSENIQHALKNNLIKYRKGEGCHQHKLKEHQVMFIRKQLENNYRGLNAKLAKMFNVHPQTITMIKQNESWSHLC
jgi:hypothetical protein